MLQELHLKLLELYSSNAMDHPHGDQWPDRAILREEPLCLVARVVPSAARAPGGRLARHGLSSALAGVCRISGQAVADDVSSEATDWNCRFAGCMQDSHACPGWRPGKPGDYAPA